MKNPEGAVLVQMVEGFKMFAGESLLGKATRNTAYEPHQSKAVKQFASSDPRWVFFDVGASLGYWSLFAKKRLFFNGQIYSIEPSLRSFELLCASVEANGFADIHPFNIAVSDVDGEIDFALNVAHDGDHRLASLSREADRYALKGWQVQEVLARRIDTFIAEQHIPLTPNRVFMKVDVQGAEPAVLDGSAELFRTTPPVVLIEQSDYHLALTGHAESYLDEWLKARGYTTHTVGSHGKGIYDILGLPPGWR